MSKNKHTDLDGLIDLDSRSLIKLGNSAVVSIPSADDLGIIGNIDELDAAVSVRHWSVQGDRRPTRCGSMTNWHELTGFQRDLLKTLAGLERHSESVSGQDLCRQLVEFR